MNSKKKELVEYKQTQPEQLKLFELTDESYSNTIELYDSMPKYFFGGVEREKGKTVDSLPILNREFMHRNRNYKLSISPASIQDKKTGKTINYYPSQREELIEDAIRKIATKPNRAFYFDNEVGVKFTYYELQQELKRMGHGYAIDQIKLGIEIINKSVVEITSKEGNEVSITSSLFSYVGKETKEKGGKERVVVIFNPLVTRSINQGTYRLINYDNLMKMKMPLSRWLHKRISHIFTQAALTKPFNILLSTIVRDSGMKSYKTISERMRQVSKALNELKNNDVLSDWKVSTDNYKQKNKILDALYLLYVSESFVDDAKKATKFTNMRLVHGDFENNESYDEDALREELEHPIYRLSKTVINGIIAKISNIDDFNRVSRNLAAAKNYIVKKKIDNPAAAVQKAIREDWLPPKEEDMILDEVKKIEIKNLEQKERQQTNEEDRKKLQEDPSWIKVRKKIKQEYGEKEWNKWFEEIQIYSVGETEVILCVESKFKRDWIIREFVEHHADQKSIKSLIQGEWPNITKVSVVVLDS